MKGFEKTLQSTNRLPANAVITIMRTSAGLNGKWGKASSGWSGKGDGSIPSFPPSPLLSFLTRRNGADPPNRASQGSRASLPACTGAGVGPMLLDQLRTLEHTSRSGEVQAATHKALNVLGEILTPVSRRVLGRGLERGGARRQDRV